MDNFVRKYALSKTLRFELKPVGETTEHIEDFKSQAIKDVVAQDKKRADDYKEIKKIIDDYHRDFIEQVLSQKILTNDDIQAAFDSYLAFKGSKDENKKKQYQNIQKRLRTKIAKVFAEQAKEYVLFNKELINEKGSGENKIKPVLWQWLKRQLDDNKINQEDFDKAEKIIKNFDKFSTYFTGFNQNRQNIYSAKEQSTAISYRIVHDNMVKHFNNGINFDKIQQNHKGLYDKLKTYNGIFAPAVFSSFLSQGGIDVYNEKIGHRSDDINATGVNQLINEYRQKNNIKNRNLPMMTTLFKQILSKKENGFKIDVFTNPREVADEITEFYNKLFIEENILQKLKDCFKKYFTEEILDSIYIKGDADLKNVLIYLYEGWNSIPEKLKSYTGQDEEDGSKKKKDFYSVKEIQEIIDSEKDKDSDEKNIFDYFISFKKRYEIKKNDYQEIEISERISQTYSKVKPVLDYQTEDGNLQNNEDKKKIPLFMDSLNSAVHFLKPLYIKKKGKWLLDSVDYNIDFYEEFNELYEKLVATTKLYDKTRNYVTKKPYKTDKFKINFENSTLLDGWDVNKETDNTSILLLKDSKYYLGIMPKRFNNLFDYKTIPDDSSKKQKEKSQLKQNIVAEEKGDYYEKMVYKLLPDPAKMLPKVFFSARNIDYYQPSNEIIEIREKGLFKKEAGDRTSLRKWIDFMKQSLAKHPEWGEYFDFKFKATNEYQDSSQFYKQVAEQGYCMSFDKIKTSYIEQKIADDELYLFEIYSKDFSKFSKGRPNLHTSYWKLLFSKENLDDLVLKLNGQAEIFFRPASLKKSNTIIHRANKPINNKNPLNPQKQSTFDYDIIKDKRFTKDKFFFHCPITLNFKAASIAGKFNDNVNAYLKDNPDVNIIGIDRGERHLLYYSVIDQQGNIITDEEGNYLQGTLNTVKSSYKSNGRDIGMETDYNQLLKEKGEETDDAQKSWSTIGNIKELKSGYLSHIVHKIAKLMIKHNAIVVLEDLNFGFKRGRFKIRKQVYQKFEKALIDKLNYLVFKDKTFGQAGHYLSAYQLTAPFVSFQKLGIQSGFLFYIWPQYTSKIDPVTGFVNRLSCKSVEKSKEFFSKFDSICFDSQKNYFEFTFNYANFPPDKTGRKKKWTVCTVGKERYRYNRQDKKPICYDVTAELKKLFREHKIDFENGENLINSIANMDNKKFFKDLLFSLGLTLQLRHSYKENQQEIDFILSPVADKDGNFFDSRNAKDNQPKDADGNGAFNIARKGLMVLEQINKDGKPNAIKNVEWFDFAQKD